MNTILHSPSWSTALVNRPRAAVPDQALQLVDGFGKTIPESDLKLIQPFAAKKAELRKPPGALKDTLIGMAATAAVGSALFGIHHIAGAAIVAAVAGAGLWVAIPAGGLALMMGAMGMMAMDCAKSDGEACKLALMGLGAGALLGAAIGGGAGLALRTAVHALLG